MVDATTVSFKFATKPDGTPAFDPRWNANLMNEAGQAFNIQSTAVRDQMGEDWMRDNPLISTGPMQIVSWVQDDKGVLEKVPYDHWRKNSQVDRITFIEVAEESTKVAMLSTGEIDGSEISVKSAFSLLDGGFATGGNGGATQEGVFFPGNLWETHNALSGEPLDTAAVYMRELPWIGDPNKPGDRDQAKLVRNALARAFDRDLINQVFLNGIGWPVHVEYFSTRNPRWQSKWEYPYDPAESERLLEEAGFPRRANGVRFEIPFTLDQTPAVRPVSRRDRRSHRGLLDGHRPRRPRPQVQLLRLQARGGGPSYHCTLANVLRRGTGVHSLGLAQGSADHQSD